MPFDEEKQIQQLISLYRQGFEEILRIIVQKEAKGQWTTYYRDALIQIKYILQQLDSYSDKWIQQTVGQVYSQSTAETAAFLSSLGKQKQVNPEFAQLHQRAIDVVAQNMADNMHDATQFIGRHVNDIFRQIGLEESGSKYASGATIRDMKKKMIQRMMDEGQTAFVNKLGRKWRLDSYAEMVARTTTREAASVATINECKEFDIDLVTIPTHYPTCEICAPLQGKVFSISGKDKRYPRLLDEYRPPIHPNCRHSLQPYVREFDDDADERQNYSNTSLTKDVRSETEKNAYKEIRDEVTTATTRKRAREVLYNESVPMTDKIKAADRLFKTYEKRGTIPVGKDASILKQYKDWLKDNAKYGLITSDNANIVENKLLKYALNNEHPKGKDKAVAFEKALGYNKDNYKELIKAIKENINDYPAIPKGETKYGELYEVSMIITGPNGKSAKIKSDWIIDKGSEVPRLTTIYVD